MNDLEVERGTPGHVAVIRPTLLSFVDAHFSMNHWEPSLLCDKLSMTQLSSSVTSSLIISPAFSLFPSVVSTF